MRTQNNDVRVTIRVDRDLKEQADILFSNLGMNMTTALTVFLRKAIAEEAIPFQISAKKADFAPADITKAFEFAVKDEVARLQQRNLPVARYDVNSKRAYLEQADGTREYVNG